MKKLSLFLILFFCVQALLISQNCLPDGIVFTNQEEIDNFQSNYPGCTCIEGDVVVHEDDISNLLGLDVLTEIQGYFMVYETQLTNLQGLNALEVIAGNLIISRNSHLDNLLGLDALYEIGGELSVGFSSMKTFVGIPNISSVGGLSLYFTGTHNFTGLEGLSFLNGDLSLSNIFEIEDLSGLENLEGINGYLKLNFTTLKSLNGLNNIDYQSIQTLNIVRNDSLSECHVLSVCEFIANPLEYINIHSNAEGCNSIGEIEASCYVGVGEDNSIGNDISLYPNPAHTEVFLINPRNVFIREVHIYNQAGQKLWSGNGMTSSLNVSGLSKGLYFVELVSKGACFRKKLIVE